MTTSDKIRVESISELEVGKLFEVYIFNPYNPSNFYVQMRSNENQFRKMMYELAEFYSNSNSLKNYKIRGIEPGIMGLPCAALCYNQGNIDTLNVLAFCQLSLGFALPNNVLYIGSSVHLPLIRKNTAFYV